MVLFAKSHEGKPTLAGNPMITGNKAGGLKFPELLFRSNVSQDYLQVAPLNRRSGNLKQGTRHFHDRLLAGMQMKGIRPLDHQYLNQC